MTSTKELPKVIEKSPEELEEIIKAVKSSNLPETIIVFVISCIHLATWLPKALVEHKITVKNFKKLIFGKGYKAKTKRKNKNEKDTSSKENQSDGSQSLAEPASNDDNIDVKEPKGHGRNPHTAYTKATEHEINIDNLVPGQYCPLECGGKLYSSEPGVIVNIKGQNLASVDKYFIEKLRCALCSKLFSADIPANVHKEKYHPSFKAMLALQKYFMGVPFNRQEHFQSLLGLPLSASTQWQLMEELAGCALPVFKALEQCAANGNLIQNDDTTLKIVDLIHHNRLNPDTKRTGMFTTGILSHFENHKIALFYNGKRHSGENMTMLLDKRDAERGKVIQMCDALSHNIAKNHETTLCNCLSHGFRKFDDLHEFYPECCLKIWRCAHQHYLYLRIIRHQPL